MTFGDWLQESEKQEITFDMLVEKEDGSVLTGAELARQMGTSRANIKQLSKKAITKLYDLSKEICKLTVNDDSPTTILIGMAQALEVENDKKGLKVIFNNLSKEQQKALLDDLRKKNPHMTDVFAAGPEKTKPKKKEKK